ARETLDAWEAAPQTRLRKPRRADSGNVLAHEQHLARGRGEQAGKQVHQRGLAGTVRPHHGDQFFRADSDADLFERAQHPIVFADAFGFEQRRHAVFPAGVRRRLLASPASPSGKAMTITARTAPRMKRQYWVSDCS